MKKFLTFILVLAMVMSVSSVAMAAPETHNVNTAEALNALVDGVGDDDANDGDTINLTDSFSTSQPINITKSVTINGNGKTITYTGSDRAIDIPTSSGSKVNVTIKDLTVSGSAQRGINYNDDGELTLENVNVGTFTYALNLPGNANDCKVTINGGSYTGCIAINVWGKNSAINVNEATLTSVDDAEEGYAVVKLNNNGGTSAEGTVINVKGGSINVTGSSHGNTYVGLDPTVTGEIIISSSTFININDGKPNTKEQYVAIIKYPPSDNFYSYKTLEDAVAAAQDGDTITLLTDSSGNGIVFPQGKFSTGLTIDFDGHTYTVTGNPVGSTNTETQAFQILRDNKVTLKNGILTSTADSGVKMLVQNYSDLTLENMKLDGTNIGDGNYTLSNNFGNITIDDTEIIAPAGGVAFDVYDYAHGGYTPAPEVTVKGDKTKVTGKIEVSPAASLQITGGEFSEKPDPAWVDTDKVAVGDDDGEGYVIDDKKDSASIHVAPESLDFGSKDYGYSAVGEKTFVITNDGNVDVFLAELKSDFFDIAHTLTGNLLVGQSVTVKVAPKNKLAAAKYAVPVNVVANYYPDNNTSATPEKIEIMVTLKFEVKSLSSGGGYYGPNVWYIGGNTFGTNTNQVPTSVEIDGVPVSFTMNGSQITVGCIQPGSGWVTVRWGSVSNYRSFTPDANAYCAQTVIPKTGGMSIWAAIAQFLGF